MWYAFAICGHGFEMMSQNNNLIFSNNTLSCLNVGVKWAINWVKPGLRFCYTGKMDRVGPRIKKHLQGNSHSSI